MTASPEANLIREAIPVSTSKLKLAFGFCLLGVIAGLALAIALGHVEEKTSFGLQPILGSLGTLGGMFAQWAFHEHHKPDKPETPPTPPQKTP